MSSRLLRVGVEAAQSAGHFLKEAFNRPRQVTQLTGELFRLGCREILATNGPLHLEMMKALASV
jgi:hypothetical protein